MEPIVVEPITVEPTVVEPTVVEPTADGGLRLGDRAQPGRVGAAWKAVRSLAGPRDPWGGGFESDHTY